MSLQAKTINILGVTGSIGRSAVDVILSDPERFDVQVVTAYNSAKELAEVARRLKARKAVIGNPDHYKLLQSELQGSGIEVAAGIEALEAAACESADLTLAAIVGMAGLRPVMAAIRASKVVAIANKEPLVAAGPLVLAEARKHNTKILPVDSEHNAIFQVFDFERSANIKKIILTASGGPFRTWSAEQVSKATLEQALAHPNWSMGRKITIDSATMINKGLEVIEAHYLFGMPADKIDVIIHPQSIIHSMVEYSDGSVLAQMGASDMRTPIAYALAWPERMETPGRKLDWTTLRELNFEKPDFERFPGLRLSYEALQSGQVACISLNAANEIAVDAFLDQSIGFTDIIKVTEHLAGRVVVRDISTLNDVESLDKAVRELTRSYITQGVTNKTVSIR